MWCGLGVHGAKMWVWAKVGVLGSGVKGYAPKPRPRVAVGTQCFARTAKRAARLFTTGYEQRMSWAENARRLMQIVGAGQSNRGTKQNLRRCAENTHEKSKNLWKGTL